MWEAWADDRMDDVLATMDSAVIWRPSTLPSALGRYEGHEGVRKLRADAVSVHGSYWTGTPTLTLQDDGSVEVHGLVIQDDPDARMKPTEAVCVLRDGLIVSIDPCAASDD
jgi:hypothetical protein